MPKLNLQLSNKQKRLPIGVVQRILAIYRAPIFHLISSQVDYEVSFFATPKNNFDSVATIAPADSKAEGEHGGLQWHFLRNLHFGPMCWQIGSICSRSIREQHVLIFEGSVYYLSTWVSATLARFRGQKVLMWTHGFLQDEKGIKNFIRTLFYSLADGHLLYGNRGKQLMLKRGFDESKLHVIYNSLDFDRQTCLYRQFDENTTTAVKEQFFANPTNPLLIFIGRLTSVKKLDQILLAAQKLKSRGIEINVLFVGDGPSRERLHSQAESLDLSNNVHFFGACYDDAVTSKLVYAADICVSPGEVGLTAIHSLTFGTPVITHWNPDFQMPEFEAISHNYNGMLFEMNSIESLADSVATWITTNKDRRDVRDRCREIIELYYNPKYQLSVVRKAISQCLSLTSDM